MKTAKRRSESNYFIIVAACRLFRRLMVTSLATQQTRTVINKINQRKKASSLETSCHIAVPLVVLIDCLSVCVLRFFSASWFCKHLTKMRWGESDTCKFAKLYIQNQCLWNYDHPDYKMKHKRVEAFREMIAEFYDSTGIKLSEVEVRIKIKNLRSTYSQELNKIKIRSTSGANYKPTIKWFYDFHKHLNKWRKRDNDESYDDVNLSYDTQEEGCQEIWAAPSTHAIDTSDPFPETDDDYKLLDLKPEPDDSHIKQEVTTFKVKKKKLKRRHPSMDGSDRTFRGSLDSGSESAKEDEFDIYGKYIATQLRKMNLQKALRVQLEIQSLVSEARISGISK